MERRKRLRGEGGGGEMRERDRGDERGAGGGYKAVDACEVVKSSEIKFRVWFAEWHMYNTRHMQVFTEC
jgi:hypothetical protein